MSNLINLVIHPELEPGVIDNAMIHRALIEYGMFNGASSVDRVDIQ